MLWSLFSAIFAKFRQKIGAFLEIQFNDPYIEYTGHFLRTEVVQISKHNYDDNGLFILMRMMALSANF
jgi:hypothetical protein